MPCRGCCGPSQPLKSDKPYTCTAHTPTLAHMRAAVDRQSNVDIESSRALDEPIEFEIR